MAKTPVKKYSLYSWKIVEIYALCFSTIFREPNLYLVITYVPIRLKYVITAPKRVYFYYVQGIISPRKENRTNMGKRYKEDDGWKYCFYVVNSQQEFVYGFDDQREAEEYAKRHNAKRRRRDWKCIPFDEAMQYSAGLTPDYENAWSQNWTEP